MEVGENIFFRAERVYSECRENMITQMAGADWKAAERISLQLDRLNEICEESRRREADSMFRKKAESQLETAMRKMGEIAADFVFEHEDSNTKEMAAFFAGLGYAGGDMDRAGGYADNLRLFGYNGQIELAFREAGELSDDTIPVMEAFHQLQENFMLRENGDEADALVRDFFDSADIKRFKKACRTYLERTEGKNTGEVQAVAEASRQAVRAEELLRGAERKKITFADMLRQEERERGIGRVPNTMERTERKRQEERSWKLPKEPCKL